VLFCIGCWAREGNKAISCPCLALRVCSDRKTRRNAQETLILKFDLDFTRYFVVTRRFEEIVFWRPSNTYAFLGTVWRVIHVISYGFLDLAAICMGSLRNSCWRCLGSSRPYLWTVWIFINRRPAKKIAHCHTEDEIHSYKMLWNFKWTAHKTMVMKQNIKITIVT
jgi:hypothetical protein